MSLARPETREEWRLHWDCIGFCWQEDAPLRERQAVAQFQREHFRCGGCSGPATRRVPDPDPETGEELGPVPLCDECTIADAIPPEVDWSDEHKAARVPPAPDWGEPFTRRQGEPAPIPERDPREVWFSFTIERERWLRGQGDEDWLLEHPDGRLCAVGYYLVESSARRAETSYNTSTPERLSRAYEACTGLHHLSVINERTDIDDSERERLLVEGFAAFGVTLTFA